MNRVKFLANRYHHDTSSVDNLHYFNNFLYYMFSEISCFKYENEAYLIKYVLICITFQNKNLNIG